MTVRTKGASAARSRMSSTMQSLLAALLVGAVCPVHASATLGRLFLTPEQRVTLERLRHAPATQQTSGAETEAPTLAVDPVRVDGYVERHDGHSSVWFNSAVVHDHMREYGLQAIGADLPEVEVRLADGNEVRLRVGQTYDPVSNTVLETWQREPATKVEAESSQAVAAESEAGSAAQ